MVVWSRMNQSDPPPAVQSTDGAVMGDLTGFVRRVDQKARTVEVSEKLGVSPVTMTVTDDTAITVRGEQRGLRDLKQDLPVRAFYEVRNDVKYVTRLQVVTDEVAQPAVAAAESASQPTPAARPSATFNSAARPARGPADAAAPAQAPAPAPTPALAATVAPASPPPLVPPIAPAPPLTPVAEAPAPARQTVSADSSVSAAGPDGSEAVDWLLKRRR